MASNVEEAPRALVHQRILQQAEADADATMREIAEEVSGSSVELVERVLDEYGDPAESSQTPADGDSQPISGDSTATTDGETPSSDPDTVPEWDALSDKVRQTLREVNRHPEETQQEIADRLDVTAPTVSNRLAALEGFDWTEREEFIESLPDQGIQPDPETENPGMTELERPESDGTANEESTAADPSDTSDPELVHEVIRVCMDSDEFSRAEELALISWLI